MIVRAPKKFRLEQTDRVKQIVYYQSTRFDKRRLWKGIKMARKHLGWYSKGLANSSDFRVRINQLLDAQDVRDTIQKFYDGASVVQHSED